MIRITWVMPLTYTHLKLRYVLELASQCIKTYYRPKLSFVCASHNWPYNFTIKFIVPENQMPST